MDYIPSVYLWAIYYKYYLNKEWTLENCTNEPQMLDLFENGIK